MSLELQLHFESLHLKMDVLRVSINHGFGCILLYKPVFEYILQERRVTRIEYSMPLTYLREQYPPAFHSNLLTIADRVMSNPNIIRVEDVYEITTVDDLMRCYNVPRQIPILPEMFSGLPRLVPGDYITLNMKVTDIPIATFETRVRDLAAILSLSRYPIVLTGERALTPCSEYMIHKNHMYSMYSMIRPLLPNAIDKTYPETVVANEIDCLKTSGSLYTHSVHNVFINSSGGCSFLFYFGHMIGMTLRDFPTLSVLKPNAQDDIIVHSLDAFMDVLRSKLTVPIDSSRLGKVDAPPSLQSTGFPQGGRAHLQELRFAIPVRRR